MGRTRQVKNIFRGIVAASSHDRKGRRNVTGPEGYVDVPDIVVSRNKHGCIPDGSILVSFLLVQAAQNNRKIHVVQPKGFFHILNHQNERIAELSQLVHQFMAD